MTAKLIRWSVVAIAACYAAAPLLAQTNDVPRSVVQIAPAFTQWSFNSPLVQDGIRVKNATQLTLPLSLILPIGNRWTLDMAGAYAVGRVALANADSGMAERTLSLSGPTDVKARLVGRTKSDRIRVTLGVNIPTGTTKLDDDQLLATRVLGAPAFRAAVPTLGSGLGATAGIVFAQQAGDWAFAVGTSYELRGSYSPIEASIAGGTSMVDLDPANAIHLTVGADRLIGSQHRLSMMVVTDMFGADRITLPALSSTPVNSQYTMGPSVTALAALELGVVGFREFTVSVSNRYRSAFERTDGIKAVGSSGNFFDAQWRATTGARGQFGWVFGADARVDTGMEVDNSLATAAIAAVGVSFGATIPSGTITTQPFMRAMFGSMNTGIGKSTLTGVSVGVSLNRF